MFDEATILARLQNGEDVQKIADEMAAALNKVNKLYSDQKAKEEAERAAAKRAESQKKEDLQEIIDLFMEWLSTYYNVDTQDKLTADQVIELIDSIFEYVEAMKGLEHMFAKKAPAKVVKTQSADDTLNAFLNKMGW